MWQTLVPTDGRNNVEQQGGCAGDTDLNLLSECTCTHVQHVSEDLVMIKKQHYGDHNESVTKDTPCARSWLSLGIPVSSAACWPSITLHRAARTTEECSHQVPINLCFNVLNGFLVSIRWSLDCFRGGEDPNHMLLHPPQFADWPGSCTSPWLSPGRPHWLWPVPPKH